MDGMSGITTMCSICSHSPIAWAIHEVPGVVDTKVVDGSCLACSQSSVVLHQMTCWLHAAYVRAMLPHAMRAQQLHVCAITWLL